MKDHLPPDGANTEKDEEGPLKLGCAHFAALFVGGLIGLISPFFVAEFEGARERAISLMMKSLVPGAIVGAAAAVWKVSSDLRPRTKRPTWGKRYAWFFAFAGYAIFTAANPELLSVLFGFASGVMLAFLVVYPPYRALRKP